MNLGIELEVNELKYAIEKLFIHSGLSVEQAQNSMPFCFPGSLTEDERNDAENSLHNKHLIRAVAGDVQLDLSLRVATNSVLAAMRYMELNINGKQYRIFIASDYMTLFSPESNSYRIIVYEDKDEAVNTIVSLVINILSDNYKKAVLSTIEQQPLDKVDRGDLEKKVIVALTMFNFDAKLMWIAQISHRTKGGLWLTSGENPNARKLYCVDTDNLCDYIRDVFRYADEGLHPLVAVN